MTAIDLFAVAAGNSIAVNAAFEAALAALSGDDAKALRAFAAWVESEALVSVNVKLFVLTELINGRTHQNVYEWAQEQADLCGRDCDEILREQLQGYYERRTTFDRAFVDGQRFRYGALNGGCAGLQVYAPYCLVLSRDFIATLTQVAVLPGDSLKICFKPDGSYDAAVIHQQVGPYSHRHGLTAAARATEVRADRSNWPALLIAADRYFEVVFVGEVGLASVDCVRVLKSEHDRMWDMAFANFGRKVEPAARAMIHDFVQLRKAHVGGRLRLEVIDESAA